MTAGRLDALTRDVARVAEEALADSTTWMQFGIVVAAFALAWLAYRRLSRLAGPASLPRRLIGALDPVLQPAITALLLLVAAALGKTLLGQQWVLRCAAVVAILWLFESCIRALRVGPIAGRILRIIGIPLLTLHLLGVLEPIAAVLESMSVEIDLLGSRLGNSGSKHHQRKSWHSAYERARAALEAYEERNGYLLNR